MDLFEKLAAKQQRREKASIDAFRDLVRIIAAGQEPAVDQEERVLSDAGRSLDDLRTAVELYQKRVGMRTPLDSLPKMEAERKEIERRLSEADEALAAAERQHAEVTGPLRGRLEQLQLATREAERCRQQLVETCPDEELRQRLADLQRQHDEAAGRSLELRREIDYHKSWTKFRRAEVAHATTPLQQQQLRLQAGQHEAEARAREGAGRGAEAARRPGEGNRVRPRRHAGAVTRWPGIVGAQR